jgi:transcription elongation factor
LGFVLEFDNRQMDMQIAIVPRIPFTSERTRRPAASLFDKEAVIQCYGPESVWHANRIHVFQGREFKNGLLERTLGITDIFYNDVNPTHSELGLFARCADQDIVAAAYQEMVRTQVRDRIQVVTGGLQGLEGRLTDVDGRGTATLDLGTAAVVPQVVSAREICKKFRLGDSVCVISGDHQGAKGYIIAMENSFASVYCRLPRHTFSSGGQEVVHSAH